MPLSSSMNLGPELNAVSVYSIPYYWNRARMGGGIRSATLTYIQQSVMVKVRPQERIPLVGVHNVHQRGKHQSLVSFT